VCLTKSTRLVQAGVHFSYNWSQLLPYADMRKVVLFWRYYSALLTIIPLNITVEFNIATRRTKTTSSCRMDFVMEENSRMERFRNTTSSPHTPQPLQRSGTSISRRGEGNLTSEILCDFKL